MSSLLKSEHTLEQVHADPVFQELNPEGKEFLDVRWLPPELNPFTSYSIRIGALVLKRFPHIKTIATVQMMLEDFEAGFYEGKRVMVVPSSGNTAHAVVRVAPAFGFEKTLVVLAADVPSSKKEILAALSASTLSVGRGSSVQDQAKELATIPGYVLLDQYSHMGNVRAHYKFTGPEIRRVLGDDLAIVAVSMGSGGTVAGVGKFYYERKFFPKEHVNTLVLGVRPSRGQRVPGARDELRMEEVVTLPWKKYCVVEELTRKESFLRTRQLWSAVEPQPGPTSGLAYGGLLKYLEKIGPEGLRKLEGKCVGFLCPDSGFLYSDLMKAELDTDQGFPMSSSLGLPTTI